MAGCFGGFGGRKAYKKLDDKKEIEKELEAEKSRAFLEECRKEEKERKEQKKQEEEDAKLKALFDRHRDDWLRERELLQSAELQFQKAREEKLRKKEARKNRKK